MITIIGKVIKGQQQARLLGFPTANIPYELPITEGIYAATCDIPHLNLSGLKAIAYYKNNLLEAHLLDQELDLYDRPLRVQLTHFIRLPVPYESDEIMVRLIQQDIAHLNQINQGCLKKSEFISS